MYTVLFPICTKDKLRNCYPTNVAVQITAYGEIIVENRCTLCEDLYEYAFTHYTI